MDAEPLRAVSRLCGRPLPGLLPAMVRNAQSPQRGMLGYARQAYSEQLAQLLYAGSPGRSGRLQNVRALSIRIASTTPSHSKKGNRVTAVRWFRLLRALGHRVRIEEQYKGGSCDVLIAMHARRSRPSIVRFRRKYPERPLILALTGTDLYNDIHSSAAARRALAEPARLVLLQPLGIDEIPKKFRQCPAAATAQGGRLLPGRASLPRRSECRCTGPFPSEPG